MIGMVSRCFFEEVSKNYDLDVHELPNEISENYSYMTWHIGNEHDPGHRWLRDLMIAALRP